jgi:hypothetical protein
MMLRSLIFFRLAACGEQTPGVVRAIVRERAAGGICTYRKAKAAAEPRDGAHAQTTLRQASGRPALCLRRHA